MCEVKGCDLQGVWQRRVEKLELMTGSCCESTAEVDGESGLRRLCIAESETAGKQGEAVIS